MADLDLAAYFVGGTNWKGLHIALYWRVRPSLSKCFVWSTNFRNMHLQLKDCENELCAMHTELQYFDTKRIEIIERLWFSAANQKVLLGIAMQRFFIELRNLIMDRPHFDYSMNSHELLTMIHEAQENYRTFELKLLPCTKQIFGERFTVFPYDFLVHLLNMIF